MELFGSNIFGGLFSRKREAPAAAPSGQGGVPGVPSSTNEPNKVNGGGSFEERIILANTPMTALSVSPVYRALKLWMDTLGIMPVQYRKKDYAKGNFVVDMSGLGKRINYLLQVSPNPVMTAKDMWKQVTYNQQMRGNAFVYIERDEFGFPYHLWLAIKGTYNIVTGRYNFIQYLSDEGYITINDVSRDDVMHFANTYRYNNGFWGMSTLEFAANELSLIKTEKAQALETAAKGGRVKGFISEEKPATQQGTLAFGMYSKDATENYANEVNDKVYRRDINVLRGMEKFQSVSMTSQDMQIIEQLNLSYDDCARYFGVPRPMLMLDTNSHYNDYQNATMEFHTRSILPEKSDREDEIYRKLVINPEKNFGLIDIHICEKPLLAMDPERKAKVAQLRLQAGLATVNELRSEDDMPAVDKGDIVYVSTNVAELGSAKLSGETGTELKPGTYTVKEPKNNDDETNK